jgi:hypothetical protein
VFWKFVLGGIEHQVIIQAKDWASAVNQGEVLKFIGVLADLPGQPRGVMVARSGFQDGALTVARDNGIVLYELRDVREDDFEGRIKRIGINLIFFIPNFRAIELVWDDEWLKGQNPIQLAINKNSDELFITDPSGNHIKSLNLALHDLIDPPHQAVDWKKAELLYTDPRFLETDNESLPLVKIRGIRAEIMVSELPRPILISYTDLFEKILASVTGGNTYLVDPAGRVTQRV